jgi:hypothetical protein
VDRPMILEGGRARPAGSRGPAGASA